MQCEICGALAVDRTPPDFDGLKLECGECGKYAIAGTSLDTFRKLESEERRGALRKAKSRARAGEWPLIAGTEL